MLGIFDEATESNVIRREKVSSNRIDKTRSLRATGSTLTGYPWKNHYSRDRLPVGFVTSSGTANALGRVSAKLQSTYGQPNQQKLPQRRLTKNQAEDDDGRYAKGRVISESHKMS